MSRFHIYEKSLPELQLHKTDASVVQHVKMPKPKILKLEECAKLFKNYNKEKSKASKCQFQ